jgi:hypothetical protein
MGMVFAGNLRKRIKKDYKDISNKRGENYHGRYTLIIAVHKPFPKKALK